MLMHSPSRSDAHLQRGALRSEAHTHALSNAAVRLEAVWARDEAEVRQAQALRYQVFVEEMGARLAVPEARCRPFRSILRTPVGATRVR